MPKGIAQLGWTEYQRYGIRWSTGPYWHRFSIVATTNGFTVTDHHDHDMARVTTFALAKAWAGIRVGERAVRH